MTPSAAPQADDLLHEDPEFPETETGARRRLDFLGFAPCTMRNELRRRLHALQRQAGADSPHSPAWFMPAGCHSPNPYDDLWQTGDIEELPGLIAESGFGDFNRPEFASRWLDTGAFASMPADHIRPEFHEAGLVDPRGIHLVYGVSPEVILVDLDRLGDRPVPKSWSDILDPQFRGDIVTSGGPDEIHDSLVFNLYHDYGEEALEALGRNVCRFMHPAEMARTAGTSSPRGAAIYLLPGFFAAAIPQHHKTRVVWPDEGAYANPLYLLRRSGAAPDSAPFADYLTGAECAAFLHRLGYVPARAGSPAMPGRLRWVGWEYVRSHDLEALRKQLNAAFGRGHRA